MTDFDMSISRLYASLIGMCESDAREFRIMAATMQALHENNRRALRAYAHAR